MFEPGAVVAHLFGDDVELTRGVGQLLLQGAARRRFGIERGAMLVGLPADVAEAIFQDGAPGSFLVERLAHRVELALRSLTRGSFPGLRGDERGELAAGGVQRILESQPLAFDVVGLPQPSFELFALTLTHLERAGEVVTLRVPGRAFGGVAFDDAGEVVAGGTKRFLDVAGTCGGLIGLVETSEQLIASCLERAVLIFELATPLFETGVGAGDVVAAVVGALAGLLGVAELAFERGNPPARGLEFRGGRG
ncbi:MAG TPA: hypothetical protein VFO19_18850, partial [Vicinamibacterales bacterium]|nr:hypothetical protein [Vicinamibacterales bacterium]